MDGVERAVQTDSTGATGKPGSTIPLSLLWLAIDECEGYLRSLGSSLDEWVSRENGAKDAVLFARTAERAYRTHPIEEKARRLHRQRCPECSQLSLVWHPTPYVGGDVHVTCGNGDCLHDMDQSTFETLALIEGRAS